MKNQPRTHFITFLLISFLFTALIACSSFSGPDPDSVYTRVTDGDLKTGDSIPEPEGAIILTISGKIGTTNQDNQIVMDLATVERVGLVDYTVTDPFNNETITFRGVLMRDLLDLWQVDEAATALETIALNDYFVDVPIAPLREFPVIFALQANGEYMEVSDRGPAMLVFPYEEFEFEQPLYDSYWVWQIAKIEAK
ncbi:MAG: hypothetical protein AAF485_27870 [Chloroflexota bacterium]